MVQIVGARFESEERAFEALDALRSANVLDERDADVGRLGTTDYEAAPADEAILAARIDSDVIGEVARVVEELGGELLVVREAPTTYDPRRAG